MCDEHASHAAHDAEESEALLSSAAAENTGHVEDAEERQPEEAAQLTSA